MASLMQGILFVPLFLKYLQQQTRNNVSNNALNTQDLNFFGLYTFLISLKVYFSSNKNDDEKIMNKWTKITNQ